MHKPADSPYLIPFDGSFSIDQSTTAPPSDAPSEKKLEKKLDDLVDELGELQRVLYAHDRYSVLAVFQAMDAAGKDSTIRSVFSGVNPAGCQVFAFKKPSSEELDHDFLWRSARRLPERGRIGIFNRSYYEETLIVRVRPGILDGQRLPESVRGDDLWAHRFESIRDHEKHLARNGTVIVKFFLNVSQEEQHRRFLSRIDVERKNWKFSAHDVNESAMWPKYMAAYEATLNETSRELAPWYAIPADDKDYMRMTVADILVRTLRELPMTYPELDAEAKAGLAANRERLVSGDLE